MQLAERQLRAARLYAVARLPFFARPLLSTRLIVTSQCPSLAAIDRDWNVYFHANLVDKLIRSTPPDQLMSNLAFVWTHEICHVLREHDARARRLKADPVRWNIAADMEINDACWPDMSPPDCFPGVHPDTFGLEPGHLAEYYYRRLPAEVEQTHGQVAFNEGSGVHDHVEQWEQPSNGSGPSPLESELIRQEVLRHVRSLPPGHGVGSVLRKPCRPLDSQIHWKDILRTRLSSPQRAGHDDYTRARLHRRASAFAPFVRPGSCAQATRQIACVVDTSASMTPYLLSLAIAEIQAILTETSRAWIVPCDSVAETPFQCSLKEVAQAAQQRLRGGGGTDLCAGIKRALAIDPPVEQIIVLTDGQTPYPSRRPRTPVLFCQLGVRNAEEILLTRPWNRHDCVFIPADATR